MNKQLNKKKIQFSDRQRERFSEVIARFPRVKVLVLGDFMLDEFVWGKVSRISPEAPVPVVNIERQSFVPGGALNVANNIRTLRGVVFPCGVIGKDLYGRMLLREVRREGIETGGMIYDRARRTTLKTRVVAHSQQVVRFDREDLQEIGEAAAQQILHFVKRQMPHVQAVVIGDYAKGVVTPRLLKHVLKLAKRHGVPTVLDPKEKNFPHYRGVSVMTPNWKEALAAVRKGPQESEVSLKEVGARLLKKFNCKAVVITLGEQGMCVFESAGPMTPIPTAAREVFDVSGAGDTVAAVLGLALGAGASVREAAAIANLSAGIVVGKLGTATVETEELMEAVRNHRAR